MKIALLGDIGLLGNFSLAKNPNLTQKLNKISDYLNEFDLVVGNLETPFSYDKKPWGAKSSYICTDPINIEILKILHIDVVTIANNHMYDFGQEGLDTTKKELDRAGIAWFGVDGRDYKINHDNNKLVFSGFCCYSSNPLKIAGKYGQNGINGLRLSEVEHVLKENSENGFLNIFAIHSGVEHVNAPSVEQIYMSRELAKIAPYVWYGHHPHVIQGVEEYNNSIIAHSLGNFCFAGNKDDANRPLVELSKDNRIGMILELEINNNKIEKQKSQLIFIEDDGSINLINDSSLLDEYSRRISECEKNLVRYKEHRRVQRGQYLAKRKEIRNFGWMLKRIRIRYAKLLLSNRLNKRRYVNSIIKPLKEKGYEL